MSKYFLSIVIMLVLSTSVVLADSIQQIQSPIYTDEIGRSHFLGRGGYSSVRHIEMGQAQADAVNDATIKYSNDVKEVKETINTVETDITNVIKEKETVPVSAKSKATFTSEQRKMDATAPYGMGNTHLPSVTGASGVNNSKTIYTDDLGRLH